MAAESERLFCLKTTIFKKMDTTYLACIGCQEKRFYVILSKVRNDLTVKNKAFALQKLLDLFIT